MIGLVLFHIPAKHLLAAGFGGFVALLAVLQLTRPGAGTLPRAALTQLGLGLAIGIPR